MTTKRVNLTQHASTPEQGCIEPLDKKQVSVLLTFLEMPTREDITMRAYLLAQHAKDVKATEAMIGGAPYLMAELEKELNKAGITPVYAFSVRESIETVKNGVVTKTAVFKHLGFVKA